MGQTKYYDLAFFDFGDRLNAAISVQKEIDRFVVIDKQLYGMYRIFGNGVISGFSMTDGGFQEGKGITVNISEGVGVIEYLASETFGPATVTGLPPNSVVSIYATIVGSTYLDRTVEFQYSSIPLSDGIKIGTSASSSLYVEIINNTIRVPTVASSDIRGISIDIGSFDLETLYINDNIIHHNSTDTMTNGIRVESVLSTGNVVNQLFISNNVVEGIKLADT
ncbi:hypothetical protein LCGC14_2681100, partial [marine sediment metagenome]